MHPERKKKLTEFAKQVDIEDLDLEKIDQSLTHKSYINEVRNKPGNKNPDIEILHNQRLEFLGDAVLGMIIARELYVLFPEEPEGSLTKKKSMAVCEPTLAEIGQKMEIGKYLLLGKGEISTGGRERSSNIADALEAILGAIYLDRGLPRVEKFILKNWQPYLQKKKIAEFSIDYKSTLQELLMQKKIRPEYRVLDAVGPDHNKIFIIGLFIEGKAICQAEAHSRKKAEQKAASIYLETIHKS